MAKVKKTAFLILRVDEAFKAKITAVSKKFGFSSVSEFVRDVLLKKM